MVQNQYTGEVPKLDGADAYVADPHFYYDPGGNPFGVFGLNENVDTILPKTPEQRYHPDGRTITHWRLLLYSRTKGKVIGDTEFHTALRRLALGGYVTDENDTHYLVRGLTLTELDALMRG